VTFSGLDASDERDSRQQMRLRAGKRFDVFEWRRDQERIAAMFRKRDRQRVTVSSYRRDVGRPGEVAIDYVVDPGPVTTLDVSGATLSAQALGDMREAWSQIGVDEFLEEEWRGSRRGPCHAGLRRAQDHSDHHHARQLDQA
jgi:outer membrane protein assembly factor BamA